MSTSGSNTPGSSGELPSPRDAVAVVAAPEGHWFQEPTQPVSKKYIATLVGAQLVFYIALLGPAIIGIGVKVQSIVPDDQKTSALGLVAGFGAACAVIGNVMFGRLSDRTTSRWGRRRPWIVGGTIVMTIAFLIMALSTTVPVLTVGWCLAQLGANAALGPWLASVSDQVPTFQRASVTALLGVVQNVAILGGSFVANIFADQMVIMFVGPAILAAVAAVVFAAILPDQQMKVRPPALSAGEWIATFWVNPRKHPDFAFAWLSRFLMTLGGFMFTTFRLFFLQDELGVAEADAPAAVSFGVLVFTIASVVCASVAGRISDRTGRRKFLVIGSSLLSGIGIFALAHVTGVEGFYVVEAILGAASGIYMGVDLALVMDVLPNPDDAGKDLGVFNMANALPQTVAPMIGAALLAVASANSQNYNLLMYGCAAAAALGALAIVPIKKVK